MKIVTTLTLTLTWLAKIARNGKFVPTNGHFGRMLSIDRLLFWALTFFFVIYYYKPLTIELCPWFGWKKDIGVPFSNLHQPSSTINRELKKRRRQWERQKGNRVRLAKQQLCTFITLFVHFVAVVARLQREREYKTTTFFFFFLTLIQSFRIQLQKKLRTFDELNEME